MQNFFMVINVPYLPSQDVTNLTVLPTIRTKCGFLFADFTFLLSRVTLSFFFSVLSNHYLYFFLNVHFSAWFSVWLFLLIYRNSSYVKDTNSSVTML